LPVSTADAAHLLRRSGFGVDPARLAELTKLSTRNAAVDRVLDLSRVPAGSIPIPPVDEANQYQQWVDATTWWLERMRTSPVPIVEKMTLFWHGHFVSAWEKTPLMTVLAKQNQLFRTNALGNFHTLAQSVSIDPAMLHYLDNWLNSVWGPQENFARELMELFTLGPGNYSQADVVSMAKAWTGHSINQADLAYLFRSTWHDNTQKQLFAVTPRNWNGPAALTEVIKGSKAVASSRFIAAKVFSFLAYPVTADDPVVTSLATSFRSSGWSIHALVKAIFRSTAFWSTTARRALVRSPIEYFVAAMQATNMPVTKAMPQWWSLAVGQVVFNPPDVSGWGQNNYWLNTSSIWGRQGFASHLRWVASQSGVLASTLTATPAAAVSQAFAQFGITEPSATTRAALEAYVTRARAEGDGWAVQPNLILLTALSPDFQVA
jgi:uncharacterized protein (DUF1800 family)